MDLLPSFLRPSLDIKQLFASYFAMARIGNEMQIEPRQRCGLDPGFTTITELLKTRAPRKRFMGQRILTSLSRFIPVLVNRPAPKK